MYSILVNTCDKFDDCWNPFFKLFSIYWPDCGAPVYLNTEYKDYSYPGINVTALKVCKDKTFRGGHATWSQCLKWALEAIPGDIVLYMQEDYFIKSRVDNPAVEKYAALMESDSNIKCLHLTDQSVTVSGSSKYCGLDAVNVRQRYRVCCQAALWRKDELLRLIRSYESAWEFEEFGSVRSGILGHEYYRVDSDTVKLNEKEIIPYIFTGIVQGRWLEQTRPLFEKHGIEMDWSKRGFLSDAPKKAFRARVRYRLNKTCKQIRFIFDVILLKFNTNE